MEEQETIEDRREKWSKILQSNGIRDKISHVIVSDSGAKGDGMASVTHCVSIIFEDKGKAPLDLFVKLHSKNPTHEAMLADLKAFEKEAMFFMEYLPSAKQLCESKGLNTLMDFFPKCYFGDERMIVLENLALKGYRLIAHEERHDFDTARFVLKTLAKHHAISYAMIQENRGVDKFFQQYSHLQYTGLAAPMLVNMMTGFFENALGTCTTIMMKNKIDGGEETLAKLEALKGKPAVVVLDICKTPEENNFLTVLIHGDFKNNNLMFLRDKDTNAFLHLITIDLQGVCYQPAVLDLSNYLFSSVDSNVRQTRLTDLLNNYLDTLNEVSKNLGYPIELSYEDLLMQYRKKFECGFFFGLSMVGPGMGLIKSSGLDVNKIDMGDLANVFLECLLKWIDANPDKGKSMAEEIKSLMQEYDYLKV